MKYLAIDIGGTFIKYALMDEGCQFLYKSKVPTPLDSLQSFVHAIGNLYDQYRDDIQGIALSMPGLIDSERGFAYTGGTLRYIENEQITDLLQKRCPVPISVENDAKCAALAEVWKGSLKDCNDAIVMVLGTAVGGAIIKDKKVYKGKNFFAGEFSFISTNAHDFYNMDNLFGFRSGAKMLNQYMAEKTDIDAENYNGEIIFDLANKGDPVALGAIEQFTETIAIQIANLQCILDPEKVVIGGGISTQPLLFEFIQQHIDKIYEFYPDKLPRPIIEKCAFLSDSNLIGALYHHIQMMQR